MNRRDFFGAAAAGGYSIAVFAGEEPGPGRSLPVFERIAPPNARAGLAQEPNMRLVELDCDVLVAGGGMAGVCAAVSAARHGAKVVLVQDRSRLGGNSSSEVKMHIVGANSHNGRPGWREGGLLEEFRLDDAVNNPQRSFELWDLLLYQKVVAEPNITLLLETTLFGAAKKNGRIASVMARCDKSEHLYRIRAAIFCDCTGDSRLALEAGAEMRWGREGRSEFGESLAPEKADRETQGNSILFTSRDFGRPMPFTPPEWARKITKEHLRMRKITSWEYGYWWVEWGGQLNTVRDNERIRYELLRIALGVWDYIKNSGAHPSSANWALDWLGMMPGRRENRRVIGDHILTQNDTMAGEFEDAVAIGGWPLDEHPPGGFDRDDLAPNTALRTPEVFNIPLRCLYSRNVANLMMAGRNISASHAAFSSTRVMGTCSVEGQAVGTAAALCVREKLLPREVYGDKSRLKALQQALLRDDQTIRGLRNDDPLDLARQARVIASSEEASAAKLIDGEVRDIPKKEAHHWAGKMGAEGAWLELRWDKPVRVRRVQITFDTGFQRELTLSGSDSVSKGVIRAPQPETVRDYRVYCRKAGSEDLREVAAVKSNHQRLRRHEFEAVEVTAIRIQVEATNGAETARVFEVRCYG